MTDPTRILVVDDESDMLETCRRILVRRGHVVETASSAEQAEALLDVSPAFALLVTDLVMPGKDGVALARAARERFPGLAVLVITAHATMEIALRATREGACDVIQKPFTMQEFEVAVERGLELSRLRDENELLRRRVDTSMVADIVGDSAGIRRVIELIRRVAHTDASVLLVGESGTGKELVARSVHTNSSRRARPFVPLDCGALPETLLESELFGSERGSFTGAIGTRPGVFEAASGGTIFLDEIANMPMAMQTKLLRVLQEREVRRLGGVAQIKIDVRVVAASNQDLNDRVRQGQFREDLYYRLNVVRIDVPPLRERAGDIGLIARHFVGELSARHATTVRAISSAAMMFLERYPWPGNVRELRNVLERAILLSESNQVMPADLPAEVLDGPPSRTPIGDFTAAKRQAIVGFEVSYLRELLAHTQGNISRAATLAGLQRTALHRLLVRHGLSGDTFRSGTTSA